MNSDQQNSKVCDNFRGVRAGPRRRDELGPGEITNCEIFRGVQAGPRRGDELGPPQNKNTQKFLRGQSWSQEVGWPKSLYPKNHGAGVRADPMRQDQLVRQKDFSGAGADLFGEGRISSHLKKIMWGKVWSFSQEAGSAHTSKKSQVHAEFV